MESIAGKDLKTAYWIQTHRPVLTKAAYSLGWGIVGVIWLIFAIQLMRYVANYAKTEQAHQSVITTNLIYDSITPPQTLKILQTEAVEIGADVIDVYAVVENSNQYYGAQFNYTFSTGGKSFEFSDGFVMPQQQRFLIARSLSGTSTTKPTLTIDNLQWERTHGLPPDTDFIISNIHFGTTTLTAPTTPADTPSTVITESEFFTPTEETDDPTVLFGETQAQLTADLNNNSAVGFRSVVVVVVLEEDNGTIVGINSLVQRDVLSFSQIALQFNWPRRFAINVHPEFFISTDYLTQDNLIYPGDN